MARKQHSNVGATRGNMPARACLSRGGELEPSHTKVPGLPVMSVCKLTSPVLEMWSHCMRSRVTFLEHRSPFEQHGCRAYVAECFVVTAFALELGNDVSI